MAALSKTNRSENLLSIFNQYDIDTTKYKKKSPDEIIKDIDWKISDTVKSIDTIKHQTVQIIKKSDELRKAYWDLQSSSAKESTISQNRQDKSKAKAISEVQGVCQKIREAEHIRRQYCAILDAARDETVSYEQQLLQVEDEISKYEEEALQLRKMREAARRARDSAKAELWRLEETLMASTRETDRILSEYKRYVEESKLAAAAGDKTTRSSAGDASKGATTLWANRGDNNLSMTYTSDVKLSFNKIRNITGASDAKSAADIIQSQREKYLQLKQQLSTLDEKLTAISTEKEQVAAGATATTVVVRQKTTDYQQQAALIAETVTKTASSKSETAIEDVVSIVKQICSKIPFGELNDATTDTDNLAQLLNLCEVKMVALADYLQNQAPGKSNNTETTLEQYVSNLSLPATPRMDTDSVGRSPLPAESADGGRKLRTAESESDEGEAPTRGFLKRQSRLIVEARIKKHTQRSRKSLD